MTAPGPLAPRSAPSSTAAEVGTILWALIPLLTCGFGVPVAFSIALVKRRTTATIVSLVAYCLFLAAACGVIAVYGEYPPLWADTVFYIGIIVCSLGATVHLFLIRPRVWAPPPEPTVLVARPAGEVAVDRARQLRQQARQTVAVDPMLAKRLAIGRPDLPRQFDDGGLVDLNHAPVHVLTTLPGVTETSARQIRDRVERFGPFQSLGEVLLVIEISPTFEHHLREYVVFIP